MTRVGITGQGGFIGSHFYNILKLRPDEFQIVEFDRSFFENQVRLNEFVSECDVVIHLAAMNRHKQPKVIYDTNLDLVDKLIEALYNKNGSIKVMFSSSAQEYLNNLYGRSKEEGRERLEKWATATQNNLISFIIPNVFGPFGKPFYNSFVATFCHLLTHDGDPVVDKDSHVPLIYVNNLVYKMMEFLSSTSNEVQVVEVKEDMICKVTEVLSTLERYRQSYFNAGVMPKIEGEFELNLFNTYRSFIDHNKHFPVTYVSHSDNRGSFTEIIRLEQQGQVSFSTTRPGVTRGNHFHTRKIERFSVIKGTAQIDMRKIDSDEVLSFIISGDNPGFVDMPIWYTHNIKNIGNEDLYTIFWINEFYDPEDPDTYFLEV